LILRTSDQKPQDNWRLADCQLSFGPDDFVLAGIYDPIVSSQEAEKLFGLFKKVGAEVSLSWQESGHELTIEEIQKAKDYNNNFECCYLLIF
jgi:predicted esterase